jgi:uncharacterized protein YjiS (DUF1127 family)
MDHLLPRRATSGFRPALRRGIRRILQAIFQSHEQSRQRRALARLSDELLGDIGLSRYDVARELDKPLWRT